MDTRELGRAAAVMTREIKGYPARVAHMLHYRLGLSYGPADDPADVVRELIEDILCALEVRWNRAEDAPGWPEDEA